MTSSDDYIDLGNFSMDVTAANDTARTWFNRGYSQTMGFNHEEAVRCFEKAIEADENCLMAHWGVAWGNGVNYNNPGGMNHAESHKRINLAKELSAKVKLSDVEQALIDAALVRWVMPLDSVPQAELNKRFAVEMRKVAQRFPDNVDVQAFFAESLMNLSPWKLWKPRDENGQTEPAIPETLELVSVLESTLAKNPGHPGLIHLYIHAMELSSTPEKALAYCDALAVAMPDQGHLVHMPTHIHMWVGYYKEAVELNVLGVAADERYCAKTGKNNEFYKFYRLHNYHFVCWAAMFDGQSKLAIEYASRIQKTLQKEDATFMLGGAVPLGPIYLEAFHPAKQHVLIRFGMWQEILDEPIPEDKDIYPVTIATCHYARALAYSSMGKVEEAEAEKKLFEEALLNPKLDGRVMHNNTAYNRTGPIGVLNVAEEMLAGELEYRKGNYEVAFKHLREAVNRDVNMVYDEPWGWMVPARHALGALLSEQGHYDEAIEVYRADLVQYKDNMWALKGLHQALTKKGGADDEVKQIKVKLDKASERADISINASCFCATKSCCGKA